MDTQTEVSVEQAIALLQRSHDLLRRPLRLTIRKCNPGGLTAHQTVDVKGIHPGIDWEGSQVVIEPVRPLTELTPEQVEAVMQSVRMGSSWQAYENVVLKQQVEREKKYRAKFKELADAVEAVLEDGHMNQEHLARLRAAWEAI